MNPKADPNYPVQRFLQLDGFVGVAGDDVMGGDPEGDAIMLGMTNEPMRTPGRTLPARLLIHEDADEADVRRLLGKMLEALEDGFSHLREETDAALLARAGIVREVPF